MGEQMIDMSMQEYPMFSIIVPIYNTERYLKQCLDSLVGQTYKNFEIILVDDGSTDESAKICDLYQDKYENIKVIHKKNRGLVMARKTGIEAAKGKYIGFVDSDDWLDLELLKEIKKTIDEYEPEMISFNVLLEYSNRNEKQPNFIPYGYYDKEAMEERIYPIMLYNKNENFYNFGIYPSVSNKFFARHLIEENHCRDGRITMGEDAACTYASLLAAESIYLMPQFFYHYRQNENSMTNQYDADHFKKYKILLEYLDKVLDDSKYDLKRQKLAHQGFRMKHAILNESKAPVKFLEKRRLLRNKMYQYCFQDTFKKMGKVKTDITSGVFLFLARHQMFGSLLIICEIFKKMHKY